MLSPTIGSGLSGLFSNDQPFSLSPCRGASSTSDWAPGTGRGGSNGRELEQDHSWAAFAVRAREIQSDKTDSTFLKVNGCRVPDRSRRVALCVCSIYHMLFWTGSDTMSKFLLFYDLFNNCVFDYLKRYKWLFILLVLYYSTKVHSNTRYLKHINTITF